MTTQMKTIEQLMEEAIHAKIQLKYGQISLEEAKERALPYIEQANIASRRLAKEFGVKPRLVNVSSFLR